MSHYKPYPRYKHSGVEWLGKVPNHWILKSINRMSSSIGGGTPSRDKPEYWNGNIPWVSPKDMKEEIISGAEEGITQAGLRESTAVLVPPGRVLIVVRSGILKHTIPVAINDVPVALNQDMKALAFDPNDCSAAFFQRWVQGLNDMLLPIWSKQGVTVESIEASYFLGTKVPLPPRAEQEAIVGVLAREVARVDALISRKERFVELLKERRQAQITHDVTKGLDPKAKMKDSGVKWLGLIPAHWTTAQLGKVCESRCDGPFGSGLKSEHYTSTGVRVVRLQNISWAEFKGVDAAFIDPGYWRDELGAGHDVVPGDLIMAGLGDDNSVLGRTCVAPKDIGLAMVKADCYRFRAGRRLDPEYAALVLSATARAECGFISTGATRARLNLGLASARKIPIPPLLEQSEIVENAKNAGNRISVLVSRTENSIDLLRERRSALISSAVTGQIDLREAS